MANDYRILLLDVDGTTVASNGEALPSERVIKAVKDAQNHLHVALATGRTIQLAEPVYSALGLYGPSVFNGGAEIIEVSTNQILHRQLLGVDALRELVKLALPFGYGIYTDDDEYGTPIHSLEQIESEAAKLFIEAVNTKDAISILEELTAVEGTSAHPTTSWIDGDVVDIHITHEHATKRYGVDKLLNILGLRKEQAIAIGDGHNDIPLLESAGLKVAMGNAPDEVKALADYVAPNIDEDGVAETIERYILNVH